VAASASLLPRLSSAAAAAAGGNAKAQAFFKQHGWVDEGADKRTEKYTSRAANMYKLHLEKVKQAERGRLLPTLEGDVDAPVTATPLPTGDAGLDALISSVKAVTVTPSAASSGPVSLSRNGSDSMRKTETPSPRPSLSTSSQQSVSPAPTPTAAVKPEEPAVRVVVAAKPKAVVAEEKDGAPAPMSLTKKSGKTDLASLSTKRPTNRARPALGASAVLEGAEDDFDAQFEAMAAKQQQDKANKVAQTATKTEAERQKQQKEDAEKKRKAQSEEDDRMKQYSNAKAISSDMFFERGDYEPTSAEDKERISRFQGANAIGSDAFFGREDQAAHSSGGASVDLGDIKAQAARRASQLGDLASSFVANMKSRYG